MIGPLIGRLIARSSIRAPHAIMPAFFEYPFDVRAAVVLGISASVVGVRRYFKVDGAAGLCFAW